MGRIITIVGNLGAGKTTLTRLLCAQGDFTPYWEAPEAHPFQAYFTRDVQRWALTNQLDFFLYRCQQEQIARGRSEIAIFDGGFDQDYHVFTRHIFNLGFLRLDEFNLCQRFYALARQCLPPPDLILHLQIDLPTLLARRASRQRVTIDQSFNPQELSEIENLLDEWLQHQPTSPVLRFTSQSDTLADSHALDLLILQIKQILPAA